MSDQPDELQKHIDSIAETINGGFENKQRQIDALEARIKKLELQLQALNNDLDILKRQFAPQSGTGNSNLGGTIPYFEPPIPY